MFTENCYAFLDGTTRSICKLGLFQQEYYSDHKGHWVQKYNSMVGPDGLILNLYRPIEGRRRDMFMLYDSNLVKTLRGKHVEWKNPGYCIYADKGHAICDEIQVPYQGFFLTEEQINFNRDMSTSRAAVEFRFLKITQYFAFGNYWQKQRLFYQQVVKTYFVSALLANFHTCFYGCNLNLVWAHPVSNSI